MENIEIIKNNNLRLKQLSISFIASLVIFIITSFFTLKFNLSSYPYFIPLALGVIVLNYFISCISEIHDIPLYRAIVSFVSFAIVIYWAQFFVPGFYISIISTLIASLMFALIQFFLPNK